MCLNESWSFKNFSVKENNLFYCCEERVREIIKVVNFDFRKSPHWEYA